MRTVLIVSPFHSVSGMLNCRNSSALKWSRAEYAAGILTIFPRCLATSAPADPPHVVELAEAPASFLVADLLERLVPFSVHERDDAYLFTLGLQAPVEMEQRVCKAAGRMFQYVGVNHQI